MSGKFRMKLMKGLALVLLAGLVCGRAYADGELKNGDFVATWRMRDLPAEQLIPKGWFTSEPETSGNPWVRVLDGDDRGVEITAGESSRFLFQDVRIDGTQPWTLKWKCHGEGSASVVVFPRDDNQNVFPSTTQVLALTEEAEDHEMIINMPPETTTVRIMLVPGVSDSKVVFNDLELISSP